MFHSYSPKEGLFDGTWKLPDIESVKRTQNLCPQSRLNNPQNKTMKTKLIATALGILILMPMMSLAQSRFDEGYSERPGAPRNDPFSDPALQGVTIICKPH